MREIREAIVERAGSESEAWLKLPPDSFASHLDEAIGERAAELDYRWKQHALRPEAEGDPAASAGAPGDTADAAVEPAQATVEPVLVEQDRPPGG